MFSFWVASNLPVDLKTKLEFLEENCTDLRLRREWKIASKALACEKCGDIKCQVDDLINLSVESNGTHFVNPRWFFVYISALFRGICT